MIESYTDITYFKYEMQKVVNNLKPICNLSVFLSSIYHRCLELNYHPQLALKWYNNLEDHNKLPNIKEI